MTLKVKSNTLLSFDQLINAEVHSWDWQLDKLANAIKLENNAYSDNRTQLLVRYTAIVLWLCVNTDVRKCVKNEQIINIIYDQQTGNF